MCPIHPSTILKPLLLWHLNRRRSLPSNNTPNLNPSSNRIPLPLLRRRTNKCSRPINNTCRNRDAHPNRRLCCNLLFNLLHSRNHGFRLNPTLKVSGHPANRVRLRASMGSPNREVSSPPSTREVLSWPNISLALPILPGPLSSRTNRRRTLSHHLEASLPLLFLGPLLNPQDPKRLHPSLLLQPERIRLGRGRAADPNSTSRFRQRPRTMNQAVQGRPHNRPVPRRTQPEALIILCCHHRHLVRRRSCRLAQVGLPTHSLDHLLRHPIKTETLTTTTAITSKLPYQPCPVGT